MGEDPFRALLLGRQDEQGDANANRSKDCRDASARDLSKQTRSSVLLMGANHRTSLWRDLVVREQMVPNRQSTKMASSTVWRAVLYKVRDGRAVRSAGTSYGVKLYEPLS